MWGGRGLKQGLVVETRCERNKRYSYGTQVWIRVATIIGTYECIKLGNRLELNQITTTQTKTSGNYEYKLITAEMDHIQASI